MTGVRAAGFPAAQFLRGREAVHQGHLAVHQHRVVGAGGERGQGPRAVANDVDGVAEPLQRQLRDLLVHRVVLGQQQPLPAAAGCAVVTTSFVEAGVRPSTVTSTPCSCADLTGLVR